MGQKRELTTEVIFPQISGQGKEQIIYALSGGATMVK